MALRALIYAYNRHLSFDVAFLCSTLTHCGVCDLSVWGLKWEMSYVHQSVWRWKWFSCQSSYVLQRLRLCRTSDTVFRREIESRRQWGYGTCHGDSFPAAKECIATSDPQQQIVIKMLWYQWGIVCKRSTWVSECVYVMTIFISTLVVDCVNVNVRAYVLQVGKSVVALLPCSIHFQCVMKLNMFKSIQRPNCAIEFLLILWMI